MDDTTRHIVDELTAVYGPDAAPAALRLAPDLAGHVVGGRIDDEQAFADRIADTFGPAHADRAARRIAGKVVDPEQVVDHDPDRFRDAAHQHAHDSLKARIHELDEDELDALHQARPIPRRPRRRWLPGR